MIIIIIITVTVTIHIPALLNRAGAQVKITRQNAADNYSYL